MHLLYINSNKIKLLSYKKDLFKQIQIDYFSKTHSTKLLENGRIYNTDILASATKEAISHVFKGQKISKDIVFILPSPPFITKRISLPLDVHPQALQSFVGQKILSLYPYKDLEFFYTLHEKENKRIAVAFCLEKNVLEDLVEITKILDLEFKGVIPESLAYSKLFEKTLSKTKKENIWYMHAHKNNKITTLSYFYDNFGPLEEELLRFEAKNLDDFKKRVILEKQKKEDIKFNRLILSGNLSLEIRQDLLTKEIGIWVNPFSKIIERFYNQKIKKIIDQDPKLFLKYDSHFSLLVNEDIPTLSFKKTRYSFTKNKKRKKFSKLKSLLLPFIISLLAVFLVAWAINIKKQNYKNVNIQTKIKQKNTVNTTSTPIPTPTPTVSIKRENIKIKILNGSGIKGQASKLSTYLKNKGYKDIIVGNADNFDYKKTIIKLKDKKLKSLLLNDLQKLVENPKISLETEKSLQDATIIIGQDLQLD